MPIGILLAYSSGTLAKSKIFQVGDTFCFCVGLFECYDGVLGRIDVSVYMYVCNANFLSGIVCAYVRKYVCMCM